MKSILRGGNHVYKTNRWYGCIYTLRYWWCQRDCCWKFYYVPFKPKRPHSSDHNIEKHNTFPTRHILWSIYVCKGKKFDFIALNFFPKDLNGGPKQEEMFVYQHVYCIRSTCLKSSMDFASSFEEFSSWRGYQA